MIALLLVCAGAQAESAKRILDKAAATVSNPGGVKAHFQMISKQFGTTDGEIAVKGSKFHFDAIALSAIRPGSDTPKKFDSVSKNDLDDDD